MNHYMVLDVETGGKKKKENPITELALSVIEPVNLTVIDRYQTYVKQYNGLKIEQGALDATQITMKMVESGKDVKVVGKEFAAILQKYSSSTGRYKPVIVGHNIGFDIGFLEEMFIYLGKDLDDFRDPIIIDTMFEQRRIEHGKKGADKHLYNLGACCERMGIKLHSAHGAEADVDATEQLFNKQINILRNGGTKNANANTTGDKGQSKKAKGRQFFEM